MSDPETPESIHALDLSRRKDGPAGRFVRASLTRARRAAAPYTSTTRLAVTQLARSRPALAGAAILACVAFVALFADFLANDLPIACRRHGHLHVLPNLTRPAELRGTDCARMRAERIPGDWLIEPLVAFGPNTASRPEEALLAPLTPGHPFGTDARARDLFARVVYGARTALSVGVGGTVVLVTIGVTLGASAGFFGGVVDGLLSRMIESLTSVPTLLWVLVVAGLTPHPSTATLIWTIALTAWTELARLVRAEVLRALGQDYVTAARALGASPGRVLRRHVLPNAIGPAVVSAAFGLASIVLVEATVDFLGVPSSDALPSWGETLGEARFHAGAWWLIVFPGILLLATLGAANLISEAARDVFSDS
jgi:peptide/nickel transport system permease protein